MITDRLAGGVRWVRRPACTRVAFEETDLLVEDPLMSGMSCPYPGTKTRTAEPTRRTVELTKSRLCSRRDERIIPWGGPSARAFSIASGLAPGKDIRPLGIRCPQAVGAR
jgi:hypothetical protein